MKLVERHGRVVEHLSSDQTRPAEVCRTAPAVVLDISINAPAFRLPDPPNVGIGRYLEDRAVYTTDAYATPDPNERRTIHMGIDVFLPPGEPVHAPFDGVVVGVADRAAPKDFGPIIILEHQLPAGGSFMTLYGHLARASLANWQPGRSIGRGDELARLGERHENGEWPPHLHFQLLVTDLGMGTGVWGVAPRSDLDRWRLVSPDPNLVLRVPGLTPAQ